MRSARCMGLSCTDACGSRVAETSDRGRFLTGIALHACKVFSTEHASRRQGSRVPWHATRGARTRCCARCWRMTAF